MKNVEGIPRGLHMTLKLGGYLTIRHQGEELRIYYAAKKGQAVRLTLVGKPAFKIERGEILPPDEEI